MTLRQILVVGCRIGSVMISAMLLSNAASSQTETVFPKADTIYLHGNIYTGLAGASQFHEAQRAQALAVRGDRILAAGNETDILKLKGPSTTLVDLQGHFVMPGFND